MSEGKEEKRTFFPKTESHKKKIPCCRIFLALYSGITPLNGAQGSIRDDRDQTWFSNMQGRHTFHSVPVGGFSLAGIGSCAHL